MNKDLKIGEYVFCTQCNGRGEIYNDEIGGYDNCLYCRTTGFLVIVGFDKKGNRRLNYEWGEPIPEPDQKDMI